MNKTLTTKEQYQQFLGSLFWCNLREKKLEYSPKCERCGSKYKLQCHHRFYRSRWEDTKVEDLETLCELCHRLHHGKSLPGRFNRMSKRRKRKLPAWKWHVEYVLKKRARRGW